MTSPPSLAAPEKGGCFGASAIAPAVAFPLFATIFLTDFLLAVGLADKSIFVADGFAKSTLTPAVVARLRVRLCCFARRCQIDRIGRYCTDWRPIWPDKGAFGQAHDDQFVKPPSALPAAGFAKAGVSVVVATATALGPSAGRCASFAADVFAVDSWASISASLLPTSTCSGSGLSFMSGPPTSPEATTDLRASRLDIALRLHWDNGE